MKKHFYVFLFLISFFNVFAQSTREEFLIKEKLKKNALAKNKDPKQEEAYLLHLKAESEKIGYDSGIFISGDFLMGLYLGQNRYKEVLKLGSQLKNIAKNKKDTEGHVASIYQKNALALGYLGLDDASLKDLKKSIVYAKNIEDKDVRFYTLSVNYQDLGLHYSLKKYENTALRDSLLNTYKKSLEMAILVSDNSKRVFKNLKYKQIAFTNMRLGIFYLEQSNIKGSLVLAEKYLMTALKIYQDKRYIAAPESRAMILNQVSWLYMEKKEYQKSIDYAKQALDMEKQFRNPNHRVESYEFLATCYMEMGEKEKSKEFMHQYTFLKDSLTYVDKSNADSTMKKIKAEVDNEHKESSKKQWIITGVLAFIAAGGTLILWKRKNKALRRKYEQMMLSLKNDEITQRRDDTEEILSNDESQAVTNKNSISTDTELRILKQLKAFERSEKYLKKDMTVGSLAAQLNTNTKYLSEIIKNHKSQNFNTYINTLRISYIVHKLYNDPKYREYKISYLAEECGYASSQVFVIAFKKIHGLTPSYFIQNLKEDQHFA